MVVGLPISALDRKTNKENGRMPITVNSFYTEVYYGNCYFWWR